MKEREQPDCRICGKKLPKGPHIPHCQSSTCDWYNCPCGNVHDLDKGFSPDGNPSRWQSP